MTKLNNNIQGRMYTYFQQKLGMRDYTRGWMKGDCPDCGRHDKFGINLSDNKSNCFVCGYNLFPIDVIKEVEGLESRGKVVSFLLGYEDFGFYEFVQKPIEAKEVKLPDGFQLITQGDDVLAKAVRHHLRHRGFNIKELAMKGFGYCNEGEYFGYLIIPYYLKGELIYFTTRRIVGLGPKFNNPDVDDFGVGKSLLIYNIDALQIYDKIYLVESALNAETLGDNAIGTGGKKVSNYQLSKILTAAPVSKVILLLDPDATSEAIDIAFKLIFHKQVKVIVLPENKDVNDLGRKKTLFFVRKNRYLSYNDLLKFKHKHERSKHSYQA